ncbi:hypothetical protein BaRGS_00009197 [Batillaria attramentaria]|uniref:Uncharacterized protein n=1 Tax=Batillaria attramentaria TaxID=370345 RepID=A0ABD0LJG9_9CAEN
MTAWAVSNFELPLAGTLARDYGPQQTPTTYGIVSHVTRGARAMHEMCRPVGSASLEHTTAHGALLLLLCTCSGTCIHGNTTFTTGAHVLVSSRKAFMQFVRTHRAVRLIEVVPSLWCTHYVGRCNMPDVLPGLFRGLRGATSVWAGSSVTVRDDDTTL